MRTTRALLVTLVVLASIALPSVAPAGAGERTESCRASLRDTPLADLPLPKGCRTLDRHWIVGLQGEPDGTGTRWFSVAGQPAEVERFYRSRLKKTDFDVEPAPKRKTDCFTEDDIGRTSYDCEFVAFHTPELRGSIGISDCGARSQVTVGYSPPEEFGIGGTIECLDPKGTGRVVRKQAALEYLRNEVCESAFTQLYTYPAVTYTIDQVVSAENELHDGYEPTTDVENTCKTLPITGVLKLTADQESWRLPPELEETARGGNVSPDVWLRVGSGRFAEWAALDAGVSVFRPGDPLREALEAFPIVTVKTPKDDGADRDLALEAVPVDSEGEGCVPSEPPSNLWQIGVRAGGSAPGPAEVSLRVTTAGAAPETRVLRWTRGLFPDERILIGDFPPNTTFELDPDDEVAELDEANNTQAVGELPALVCVPV